MAKIEPSRAPMHQSSLYFKGEQTPLDLYGNPVAAEAANQILCELLTAIKRGPRDESAVRVLARLVFTHKWVLYVAELHEYLDSLLRKHRDGVIRRIMNEGGHPGRPRENKVFLVHLMRKTITDENCSAARAADLVAQRFGRELGNLSAAAIKSDYSRYQHEYDRLRVGQFIGAQWLASQAWKPKR